MTEWSVSAENHFVQDVFIGMRLAGTHPVWCSTSVLESYRAAGERHRLAGLPEPPPLVPPTPAEGE
jgi:hypothetical protein